VIEASKSLSSAHDPPFSHHRYSKEASSYRLYANSTHFPSCASVRGATDRNQTAQPL
jgi:hypothetical protein